MAMTSADHEDEPEAAMLDPSEAAEEIPAGGDDDDDDHPMDSDDSDSGAQEEIELTNDSKAYFDAHTDSIFCIAAHPTNPSIFLTGGGDDTAYIWTPDPEGEEGEAQISPRESKPISKLPGGNKDSVTAATFTNPSGAYAITGGLDGKLNVFHSPSKKNENNTKKWGLLASAQEVEEINWISAHPSGPAFALGANDGSVWIYSLAHGTLDLKHALYTHTASCTGGAWTPDGKLLCTISEDGSFYAWDVVTGTSVVTLTASDQRFAVEGGLYSVAVSPMGNIVAVGGASGEIKIVGLPGTAGAGQQAGKIVAALKTHEESVESLSFHPSLPVLASAGVDGKIVLYDTSKGYSVRRILEGHVDAVVKVEFVPTSSSSPTTNTNTNTTNTNEGWLLTSCGTDGTVRRWDARTGTQITCWKGHLGGNQREGEGGVLGFVQTRDRVVTAGDDGVALVFEVMEKEATMGETVGGEALI